ncbi:hypothetical protein EVAR_36333_1 [Eumeta japonica]|uniref:C2H2-type domain-containing protein n=1 Tax=Eumeta variegata TaxID=151549 RepID=A0A4C1W882_EUMVA|nr:hypothetical protein EVAR_36333_1 [Eumeta japonica]
MPYKCTACDKSFRYKVSQRTHKCQAQPPGTVVRQSGDLIEKLLKKHEVSEVQESTQTEKNFQDITEAHAELVRTGAKLSLEDTEAESFNLIADAFEQNRDSEQPINETSHTEKINELVEPSISDLIDFDVNERNLPSPSEILKNLCLSKEDDYTMKSNIETNLFNVFL